MAPSSNPQVSSTASTSSVRRNLFTNHLSHRRGDSSQTSEATRNPSANSSTHSLSNLTNAPPSRQPNSRDHSSDSLNSTILAGRHTRSNIHDLGSNYNQGDIITRDRSGRPDLPEIPVLPSHLRLSSSSPQDAEGEEEGTQDVEGLELESAMREKEDQERIEKSLVDMMYRSRMRGNGHRGHYGHGGGGAGGRMAAENEELLALVQASLRKKVASLEEDRWMFEGEVSDDYYGYGSR